MDDSVRTTVGLPWCERGDYPLLDDLCKQVPYVEAYQTFLATTGLMDEHSDELEFTEGEVFDVGQIRDYTRLFVRQLVPSGSDMGYRESVSRHLTDRASAWVEKYSDLLHPDLLCGVGVDVEPGLISHELGVREFFMKFSSQLPVFPEDLDAERAAAVHTVNRGGGGLESESDIRGIRDLYYMSMLNVLTIPRFRATENSFTPEPLEVDGWESSYGGELLEMFSVVHASITAFRTSLKCAGKHFPVEMLDSVSYDYEAIKNYCRALLRLILGQRYDLSEVLQEDLISSEIRELAKTFDFLEEFQPYLDELRDLRARIFSHVNLIVGHKTFGDREGGREGFCNPVGQFIDEEGASCVLDLGAGEYAWFANALARARPNCEVYALDKVWDYPAKLRGNLSLFPVDFDDMGAVESLMDAFRGGCDLVLASNVFHKLENPELFLVKVLDVLKTAGGILYIYVPVYSGQHDTVTMSAVVSQDTTAHGQSVWSFEDILGELIGVLGDDGFKIVGLSLIGPERGQNDSIPRIGMAIKVDKVDEVG